MNYLKEKKLKLLALFLLFLLLSIFALKRTGAGYRPGVLGGTGPWTWAEIFGKFHVLVAVSIVVTLVFAHFDYWATKKKNEKKD